MKVVVLSIEGGTGKLKKSKSVKSMSELYHAVHGTVVG